MALSAGFDFGTSNSSIAIVRDGTPHLLPLDREVADPAVMRSLLYLTREGEQFAGQAAFDRHQRDNIGRPVKLERRYVGDVTMTFAEVGSVTTQANVLMDVNEPGRLFQSIKTLLPDHVFTKTNVFGVELTPVDLVELLAGAMLRRAEQAAGEPIGRLVVGRPVRFSGDGADDALARSRLSEAFGRLGIAQVEFLEEPVAAALSYAHGHAAADGLAVVFDFGGGTLDVSVVRTAGGASEVIAIGGVPVGGDLLDRRVVEARMLAHFGEGAVFGPQKLPVPQHLLARVLDWQTLYLLNRPEPLALIEQMARSGSKPRELHNLQTLVTRGYGAALFRSVELGKVELSARASTEIALQRDGIDVQQPLSRAEFEGIIRQQFARVEECVAETVARAAIDAADVTAVVTTGGSSRIPLVRRLLAERFPLASLIEQDALTSVAAGLAIAAAEGLPAVATLAR
jgi:hypothetical chaperone protein